MVFRVQYAGRMSVEVRNNETSGSYEAVIGDRVVGMIVYESVPGRIVLRHTIVEPDVRNQGIATALVTGALDDIAARKLTLTNYCAFVGHFLELHPQYLSLVDEAHPGRVSRPAR